MCNVWIFTLCIHMQGFLASITRDTTQSIELAIPNRPTSVMDPWCETTFHGQILNFQDSTTFRRYNLTIYPTTYFSTHTPSPPKKKNTARIFHLKKTPETLIFPASVCVALMISFMALSVSEVGDTCSSNARLHRTTATAARNRSQGSFQPESKLNVKDIRARSANSCFFWWIGRIWEKELGKTKSNSKKSPFRHWFDIDLTIGASELKMM